MIYVCVRQNMVARIAGPPRWRREGGPYSPRGARRTGAKCVFSGRSAVHWGQLGLAAPVGPSAPLDNAYSVFIRAVPWGLWAMPNHAPL